MTYPDRHGVRGSPIIIRLAMPDPESVPVAASSSPRDDDAGADEAATPWCAGLLAAPLAVIVAARLVHSGTGVSHSGAATPARDHAGVEWRRWPRYWLAADRVHRDYVTRAPLTRRLRKGLLPRSRAFRATGHGHGGGVRSIPRQMLPVQHAATALLAARYPAVK